MRNFTSVVRQAVSRSRHLPTSLGRTGRWPLLLGTLLLVTSTASVLATANSAPVFENIRVSTAAATEGQTVSMAGVVNDPDASDAHTVLIYWDGGDSNDKQKLQLPPGQATFEASHVYSDNIPATSLKVVVFDHQLPVGANDNTTGGMLSDTKFLPFKVTNVAPRFVENSIQVQKPGGHRVVVEGDFIDPGTADAMTVTATWGVPGNVAPTTCSLSRTNRHFRCEYGYPPLFGIARSYVINLTVADDDGGQGTYRTSVRIP